jgi:hypothetical protein
MRTILFLDVTGVLFCGNCHEDSCGHLRNLGEIIHTLGCDIVLSTSFRFDTTTTSKLRQRFAEHGIPTWIGVTPDLGDERWTEIRAWVEENGAGHDRLIIVDDRTDANLPAKLPGTYRDCHFFHADPLVGLDSRLTQDVLRRIGGD